jgi:hypothetical protein
MAVYGYLARLESPVEETPATPQDATASAVPTKPWSVEDLKKFAETPNLTSRTIGKVLDVLANEPGKYFSTSDLESKTGVPRANLKGAFAGLGRHTNKFYPNRDSLFLFAWGPGLGPDFPAEGHYKFDEERAERWKEATK